MSVDNLRQFIDQELPWYIERMEYSLSCNELQSLLRVVNYTKEGNWKAILSIEETEARAKAIRTAAK